MRLVWTKQAKSDLVGIRTYSVGRWGTRIAQVYARRIADTAKVCARQPSHLRSLDGVFYSRTAGSHLLIFRMDAPSGTLIVARVLHSAMDLRRHLPRGAQTSEL